MAMRHHWFLLIALAIGFRVSAHETADLLLFNGKVLTVDTAFSIKSAVAVADGKILAVGGNEVAKRYTAPARIDLHGRVLMPGFTDTHLHILALSKRDIE